MNNALRGDKTMTLEEEKAELRKTLQSIRLGGQSDPATFLEGEAMSNHYCALTVTLEADMRDEDALPKINVYG